MKKTSSEQAAAIDAPTSPAATAAARITTKAAKPPISVSIRSARKRVPMLASGSASCTPSGVAIVRWSSYSTLVMMSPERFAAERAAVWEELDAALRRCGDRPERLGRDGVRRLGTLYRATAADLAFARARF